MAVSIDPGMTFDSFVVGPENRLAWEAARTAAESPGAAYNPLFMYSDTGLGKTHLLVAIANRARDLQSDIVVVYTPLEQLLRELTDKDEAEDAYRSADILLIDDLQFLGPRRESHQTIFNLLDSLLMGGKQVALACDRPPLELGELDDRLLSRFSGGLVVDIGRPALDTRKAILELRLSSIGARLRPEVIEAIARTAIENVRQLKGALNRVLAAQRAEGREIQADEVDRLLADVVSDADLPWLAERSEMGAGSEFEEFLTDVSSAVEDALGAPRWREELARAILKWEGEGYVTKRLESYLDSETVVDATQVVATYERDVTTLEGIAGELVSLDADIPSGISLKDPDNIDRLRGVLEKTRRQKLDIDDYFFDYEKVVWDWPVIEDRLIEEWGGGH